MLILEEQKRKKKKRLHRVNLSIPLPAPVTATGVVPTDRPPEDVSRQAPAETLRKLARGFRLSFAWIPGMEQTLSGEEKTQWLNDGLTDKQRQAASIKKQLYPKHKALSALSSARSQVRSWFNSKTNPFPEKGVRIFLVTASDVENQSLEELEKFEAAQATEFRQQLQEQIDTVFTPAVRELRLQWPDVLLEAQRVLGEKFDPEDYVSAEQLETSVRCWFEPVNLELSREWKYLSEADRERELALVRQKYEMAVQKQEEFVISLLEKSLDDLHASLSNLSDGKQRTIHESTVRKVFDAMTEFRTKTVRYGILKDSSLSKVFDDVTKLMRGDGHDSHSLADELRSREAIRAAFTQRVGVIKSDLGMLLETGRVRRKVGAGI